jgi:hypothetical protein
VSTQQTIVIIEKQTRILPGFTAAAALQRGADIRLIGLAGASSRIEPAIGSGPPYRCHWSGDFIICCNAVGDCRIAGSDLF